MDTSIGDWIIFCMDDFLTIVDVSGKVEHSTAATITVVLAIAGVSSILKWLKEHS